MIARVRVDQSLADFEGAVRNFVGDVERAYWNLYYAYRRLDTAIEGRNRTLVPGRANATGVRTRHLGSAPGRRPERANFEAQARGQFYQFAGDGQASAVESVQDRERPAVHDGSGGQRRPTDLPRRQANHGPGQARLGRRRTAMRWCEASSCASRSGGSSRPRWS